MRLAKFRRFKTLVRVTLSSNARALRNFATAAQLTAPQLPALPMASDPLPSNEHCGQICDSDLVDRPLHAESTRTGEIFETMKVSGLAGCTRERWAGGRGAIKRGLRTLAGRRHGLVPKAGLCAAAASASVSLRSTVRWAPKYYRTRATAACLRVLPAKFAGSVRYTVRALAGGGHRPRDLPPGPAARHRWPSSTRCAHTSDCTEMAFAGVRSGAWYDVSDGGDGNKQLEGGGGARPPPRRRTRTRRSQLRSTTPRSVSCQARGMSRRPPLPSVLLSPL